MATCTYRDAYILWGCNFHIFFYCWHAFGVLDCETRLTCAGIMYISIPLTEILFCSRENSNDDIELMLLVFQDFLSANKNLCQAICCHTL